ncbi:HTH_Tnp_Tc3_2 domain-containing protein [Trichonephila clavipes]|nr:HTH_Tnp_Tc3_2 domain-containing protein [Trichonephila clavipes]
MRIQIKRYGIFTCTVNIKYPVKHKIYDITAAGKKSCNNRTNDDQRESLSVTDVLPQIAAYFNAGPSTSVAVRIIKRNMVFRNRKLTHVLLLTAGHKALCLGWARQHRHWTVDDWKHVAWSVESRFQLNGADECVRVWRQPHESMDPTCQQGTVQAGEAR